MHACMHVCVCVCVRVCIFVPGVRLGLRVRLRAHASLDSCPRSVASRTPHAQGHLGRERILWLGQADGAHFGVLARRNLVRAIVLRIRSAACVCS